MTDLRKGAEMALKRLERRESELHKARAELRQALAMELFSEVSQEIEEALKQPKREWVGLTDEELQDIAKNFSAFMTFGFARAIEAKLKEKNT